MRIANGCAYAHRDCRQYRGNDDERNGNKQLINPI